MYLFSVAVDLGAGDTYLLFVVTDLGVKYTDLLSESIYLPVIVATILYLLFISIDFCQIARNLCPKCIYLTLIH